MRVCAVAVLLLFSTIALAQTTTAILTGRASTGDTPLSGATVTITSPSLQGARTTQTAPDGVYTFPALPPGVYTVTFSLNGLQSVEQRAELHLAQTTRVDADLKPEIAETLTVVPLASNVLDSPEASSNFDQRFVNQLPTGRSILDIVKLAAGVHDSGPRGRVTINGAHSWENLYLVNGATITEPTFGQPQNLFIEDAIQETTVLTSGISAEYGRFSGGVVSVITKSGGNDLSASLRDTLSSDRWTSPTPFPGEPAHLSRINHDFEGTLGGRIVRDRLWFFGAGRYAQRRDARATTITLEDFTHGSNEARYEAKLTGNLGTNHTLVASYLNVKAKELNASGRPADLGPLYDAQRPNSLAALHYTGILSSNAVVEAQYTRKDYRIETGVDPADPLVGTTLFDSNTSASGWAPQICSCGALNFRNNREALVKASLFVPASRLGSHSIVAGASDFHERNRDEVHVSPSDYMLITQLFSENGKLNLRLIPDETQIGYLPIIRPGVAADYATSSAYVNDRIDWGKHLSLNAGLRYDRTNGTDQFGEKTANDSRLAQRLGATYDLRGDGHHRLTATYSRYAGKLAPSISDVATNAGQPALFYWIYEGPEVNAGGPSVPAAQALRILYDWFNSVGGPRNEEFLLAKQYSFGQVIEKKLKAPAMDEWTAGFGEQFGNRAFLRTDYVHRRWHDFYVQRAELANGTVTDITGFTLDKVIVENSDDNLKRQYDAVLLQGNVTAGHFATGGNYTWSRLWGNVEAETVGSGATAIQSPGHYYPEYFGFARNAPMGYLSADERHRANVWVSYDLATSIGRFNVSLLETYHSARNYSAVTNISLRNFIQNPGYLNAPTTSARYFFSDRGGLRVDDISATHLAVNYAHRLGAYELFVETDLRNVFNQQGIESPSSINTTVFTNVRDRNLAPFNPFTTTPIECPRGTATSSATCKGIANVSYPSTFGQPLTRDAYQQPRTLSISFGARF